MSNKVKFALVIVLGVSITTASTILLLNLASSYPSGDQWYYLLIILGVLVFLVGITVIVIWALRLADE